MIWGRYRIVVPYLFRTSYPGLYLLYCVYLAKDKRERNTVIPELHYRQVRVIIYLYQYLPWRSLWKTSYSYRIFQTFFKDTYRVTLTPPWLIIISTIRKWTTLSPLKLHIRANSPPLPENWNSLLISNQRIIQPLRPPTSMNI